MLINNSSYTISKNLATWESGYSWSCGRPGMNSISIKISRRPCSTSSQGSCILSIIWSKESWQKILSLTIWGHWSLTPLIISTTSEEYKINMNSIYIFMKKLGIIYARMRGCNISLKRCLISVILRFQTLNTQESMA